MASVYFDPAVGGDGTTVTDDANATTGLDNYGYVARFVPALSQVVAVAGNTVTQAAAAAASAASALGAPGTNATSTTSLTVGTGSKTLTIQTGKSYSVGQTVVIASTASPANQMIGIITAYNSGTGSLTVSVSQIGGSGTLAAWTVSMGVAVSSTLPSRTGNALKFLRVNAGATAEEWVTGLASANNLSDLASAATARTNLALGSLAILNTVNNGNWSGTALSVANGGTGGTTGATARSGIGAAASGANSDITSLAGLTTALSIPQGGTGATTAAGARTALGLGSIATLSYVNNDNWSGADLAVANGGTGASDAAGARANLSAAKSGANTDITSLAGLTTPLTAPQGGTGVASLTALLAALPITGGLSGEARLGGLYFKWGQVTVTAATSGTTGEGVVTFTSAFPTACAGVSALPEIAGGALAGTNYGAYARNVSASGATFGLDSSGTPNNACTVYWLAWGY